MKLSINLGAYGWRQPHWSNTFYPEDLPVCEPEDWRLTYFSNEFNAVLVPAHYWQTGEHVDCERWLDAVHDDFQFFVECHVNMLAVMSMAELTINLKKLQPQLFGLVFLDEHQQLPVSVKKQFYALADSLAAETFGLDVTAGSTLESSKNDIWRPDRICPSSFAFIENDLCDLRLARKIVEDFTSLSESEVATIIVDHAQLQASDLSKVRSMLEIMGY